MNKPLITSWVSFKVGTDVPGVQPSFQSGARDGFWIQTRGDRDADIISAAKNKAELCYGMEISDIEISNQFESAVQ